MASNKFSFEKRRKELEKKAKKEEKKKRKAEGVTDDEVDDTPKNLPADEVESAAADETQPQ